MIEIGPEHFDHHDIEAVFVALTATLSCARKTADEVNMPETDVFVTTQHVVLEAFTMAFEAELSEKPETTRSVAWLNELASTLFDHFGVSPDVFLEDYATIYSKAHSEGWDDETPVSLSVFGELWPSGLPQYWPTQSLGFRPRARIIRTIGDRLISGPEAAVIELVKNSHDADSSYVRIAFQPASQHGIAAIYIDDDGHGMTRSDIEHKWMEPATTDKRDRRASPNGRQLLGSKGIGRFAAARLGSKLKLISTAEISGQSLQPHRLHQQTVIDCIDWNAFETAEYLDQIRIPADTSLDSAPTGTSLHITELRDDWTEATIRSLHYELRRLISPIRESSDVFRMFLDLSRCTRENAGFDGHALMRELAPSTPSDASVDELAEVSPFPVLDAADYHVDGIFDESGHFDGSMTIARAGQGPEPISVDVPISQERGESPCGVVIVNLYIFDREAEAIRQTAVKAGFGTVGVREARKLIDRICGVGIYRSGFRIRPYGDPENDWLTLDTKRVQNPSLRIGHNQISGIITVEGEDTSGLTERSSREGLEENGSFQRLHSLISNLLSGVVEPRRKLFRTTAGIESKREVRFQDVYQKGEMTWSDDVLQKVPETDRKAVAKLIAKESSELVAYLKRLEEHQAKLEAQVTAGLIVGEVMHQGNTPLSFLENESVRLIRWWPGLLLQTSEAETLRGQVPAVLNGLVSSAGKLRALFDALKPLSGARRGRPKVFDTTTVIADTLFLFRTRIERLGIAIPGLPFAEHAKVRGYEADLSTAITNVVDNALHWLDYHHIQSPSITISFISNDDSLSLHVVDNGRGVPTEFVGSVFDVGFTLKPSGTGLGLSIAREAMERSSGSIECVQDEHGGHFILTLPLADLRANHSEGRSDA
ncbi:ATP-binding protein [Schlesneria sp. DSM 10557]|uniref:sensor histidine kinase n=1 Tax=Schlesneria sp. DSM 10557 TaxID=3044399 RepID=UPI0035A06256